MKTVLAKTGPTFGGLVVNFYNTFGERNAKGVLRLAVKAGLIGFRGRNHYVVSREGGKT